MQSRHLLLVLALVPALASAEIYKWTDAQGRVHYSESPPNKQKADKVEVQQQPVTDSPNLHDLHTFATAPKPEDQAPDQPGADKSGKKPPASGAKAPPAGGNTGY
jgi:hypothetical protein